MIPWPHVSAMMLQNLAPQAASKIIYVEGIAKCAQSDSGSSLGLIQNSRAPEVMRVPWIPINRVRGKRS
uniref:Plug domain-containing protein n=1 Tax=Haemonchus contortus TaxID=6289 RepID=A0A7I4Y511_HAECO